uniref:Uncharacterized protein n=1 Tax=Arundo donax TaxID=35708 RepID=A0A0A9CDT1_ARUDO
MTIAVCACNDNQRTPAVAAICLMVHTHIMCTTPARQATRKHLHASSKPTSLMHLPGVCFSS